MLAEVQNITSSVVAIAASIVGAIFAIRAGRGVKHSEETARQHVKEAEAIGSRTGSKQGNVEAKWGLILDYVADYGIARSRQGNLLGLAILAFTIAPFALGIAAFHHWGAFLALLPAPIIGGPIYQKALDRLKDGWERKFTLLLDGLNLAQGEICQILPRIETDKRVRDPRTEHALRRVLCRQLAKTQSAVESLQLPKDHPTP